jgi:hypothetical protein
MPFRHRRGVEVQLYEYLLLMELGGQRHAADTLLSVNNSGTHVMVHSFVLIPVCLYRFVTMLYSHPHYVGQCPLSEVCLYVY